MPPSEQNKSEFEKLVKANMKKAYYCALGLVGNHDDALEASQTAFVKAYYNFDTFDRSRNFFAWYYKILRNLCLNMIRYRKKFVKRGAAESYLEYADGNENTEREVENRELVSLLEKAIGHLEPNEREVLVLREFEEYSYKEISEMLDIPIGTVMSKLYYTRKKLARKMNGVM